MIAVPKATTAAGAGPRVVTGLALLAADPEPIAGKRIGLLANSAAVLPDLSHAIDLLARNRSWVLAALFGPEHGLSGAAQDMDGVASSTDGSTGLPVHSLYGLTAADLRPKREALAGLDALVVDMQDVGARYYTYVATMALAMEAAAETGMEVIVLDRPNPLGGVHTEGNLLVPRCASFVGMYPIPVRHGMTIGELARFFNDSSKMGCRLTVVAMEGWRRADWFGATGLPWIMPSPNMPTLDTATVYPGMCLVEGTNLSEGRGTTRPFEFVGAPWIDAKVLAAKLAALALPGVVFRPHVFRPSFHKFAGEDCGGVQLHVVDRESFEPYRSGLALLKVTHDLYPGHFRWRERPYEFVSEHPAIDLLTGSPRYRELVDGGGNLEDFLSDAAAECREFESERQRYLIYS